MTKILGRQVSFGIGKETVRGTAVAAEYWLPFAECDIENKVETVIDDASLARVEDSDGMSVVSTWGEGAIKGKVKDKSIGLLFLSLLGTDTVGAVEAGVKDHVFTVLQTTQRPSLTISLKDANRDERFANAVVDNLKLDAELGKFVMYEADILSKASAAGANTVAHAVENDFVPQMVTFKKAVNLAGLGAASAIPIRNFSITFKNNSLKEDVLGAAAPNDIVNQSLAVEGVITLVHNDTTFSAMQAAETYNALRFTILHTVTIGASSKPTITIDLARARVYDYERNVDINGLVEETFSFKGFYSIADSQLVQVTVRNAVTAY